MWQLKGLKVENFLGFRELQEYTVKNRVAVLIQGINNTDSETESNGAGKTSFQEIVHYGYIGTSSRKGVTDKELIHWGQDKAFFSLQFQNSKTNQILDVERTLSQKASGTLTIKLNGENQKDKFSSVNEGNKYLLELIGVSQKDFQNYYLINDEKYKPFFTSSDSEKKDFIGRFSKADSVLPAIAGVEKKMSDKDKEIEEKQRELSLLEGRLQTYEESLKELQEIDYKEKEQELKESNKVELQKIKDLIEEGKTELAEATEMIPILKKRLDSIKYRTSSLEKLSYKSKVVEIEKSQETVKIERKKIDGEIDTVTQDLTFFKKELSGILVELSEVITCPNCKYNFSLKSDKVDKEELEELKSETEKEIKNLEELIVNKRALDEDRKKELGVLLKKLDGFNKKEKRVQSFISGLDFEKRKLSRELSTQEVEQSTLETTINKNKELLKVEEKFSIKKELDKLKADSKLKIQEIEEKRRLSLESKETKEAEFNLLKDEKIEIAKWVINFKRFYTNLVNRSLLVIQGHANNFLQKMGTDLQVQLEGYKTLASGEIRENISSNLLRNGVKEGSTNSGSKGERRRLELSIIVACQSIINSTTPTGGLDLLIVDEVLDNIDRTGFSSLLKSLNELQKTIFITSHVGPKEFYPNTLTIEKTKGVSKIVVD